MAFHFFLNKLFQSNMRWLPCRLYKCTYNIYASVYICVCCTLVMWIHMFYNIFVYKTLSIKTVLQDNPRCTICTNYLFNAQCTYCFKFYIIPIFIFSFYFNQLFTSRFFWCIFSFSVEMFSS